MPRTKAETFGAAIKEIRESKQLTQELVAERAGYSDPSAYRRIENEPRRPRRDRVLAILIKGLEIQNPAQIDRLLALAKHQNLTAEEAEAQFGSLGRRDLEIHLLQPVGSHSNLWVRIEQGRRPQTVSSCFVLGAVLLSSPALYWAHLPLGFAIAAAGLYAGLFVVSLFLETAHASQSLGLKPFASFTFGLLWFTTLLAVAIDSFSIRSGNEYGLALALTIVLGSAAAEWIMSRDVLPAVEVVQAEFRPHTAQGAHLKNISYDEFAATFFWLMPLHCVLARSAGYPQKSVLHAFVVTKGGVSLSPEALWPLTAVLFGISLVMRPALLDRLKPHRSLNRYQALYYLRAVLYFSFLVICATWFTYSTYWTAP